MVATADRHATAASTRGVRVSRHRPVRAPAVPVGPRSGQADVKGLRKVPVALLGPAAGSSSRTRRISTRAGRSSTPGLMPRPREPRRRSCIAIGLWRMIGERRRRGPQARWPQAQQDSIRHSKSNQYCVSNHLDSLGRGADARAGRHTQTVCLIDD